MLHNNYNQVHHHGAGYVAPIQQKQLKKEIQKQMRAVMLGRGPGGAVASHPTAPDLNCPPRVCNECNTEHHNPKLKVCRKCRAVLPAVVETAKEVQPSKSYKDTLLAKAVPAPVNIKQAHVPVALPKQLNGVQQRHGLDLPPTPNEKEEQDKQEVAKKDYATKTVDLAKKRQEKEVFMAMENTPALAAALAVLDKEISKLEKDLNAASPAVLRDRATLQRYMASEQEAWANSDKEKETYIAQVTKQIDALKKEISEVEEARQIGKEAHLATMDKLRKNLADIKEPGEEISVEVISDVQMESKDDMNAELLLKDQQIAALQAQVAGFELKWKEFLASKQSPQALETPAIQPQTNRSGRTLHTTDEQDSLRNEDRSRERRRQTQPTEQHTSEELG